MNQGCKLLVAHANNQKRTRLFSVAVDPFARSLTFCGFQREILCFNHKSLSPKTQRSVAKSPNSFRAWKTTTLNVSGGPTLTSARLDLSAAQKDCGSADQGQEHAANLSWHWDPWSLWLAQLQAMDRLGRDGLKQLSGRVPGVSRPVGETILRIFQLSFTSLAQKTAKRNHQTEHAQNKGC